MWSSNRPGVEIFQRLFSYDRPDSRLGFQQVLLRWLRISSFCFQRTTVKLACARRGGERSVGMKRGRGEHRAQPTRPIRRIRCQIARMCTLRNTRFQSDVRSRTNVGAASRARPRRWQAAIVNTTRLMAACRTIEIGEEFESRSWLRSLESFCNTDRESLDMYFW